VTTQLQLTNIHHISYYSASCGNNYDYSLSNNPEERSSYLLRGESLKLANKNLFQERFSNKLKVLTAVLSKIHKSSATLLRELPEVSRDYTCGAFSFGVNRLKKKA
jgi:tricorn protease-like protein